MDATRTTVFLLALATGPFLKGILAHSENDDWNYDYENKWKGICRGGYSQSPIDIQTNDVYQRTAEPITFVNYESAGVSDFKVTGKGLSLNVHHNCSYSITAGGLWGHYILHHIHFHIEAEHEIDDHQPAMEAHLVHYNSKYGSLEEAMNHNRGLAVIGVLFEISRDGSPVADFLRTGFDLRGKQYIFAPIRLLPQDKNAFYRYEGSLTTPPCNEVVVWTVMKQTVPVSDEQVEFIRKHLKDVKVKHNFRSVQKLNGRQVYLYRTDVDEISSASVFLPTPFLLLSITFLTLKIQNS